MATKEQTSVEKIDKMIAEVRSHINNFNSTVQDAAVAIIVHASQYGDCSRAKMLARAVPSRLRNMLIGYFALYSPIGISIGKTAVDDKSRFIRPESKRYHDFNIDGAKANKWYDDPAKVAPPPPALNSLSDAWDKLNGFLKRLLDDARKEDEKAKYKDEDRPAIIEMANDLQTIVNRYHARQLAKMDPDGHHNDNHAEEQEEAEQAAPARRGRRVRKAANG